MTAPRPRSSFTTTGQRWVLACLLLSLPLVGLSSSLARLLGPKHLHDAPVAVAAVDPMAGWQDARRLVAGDRRITALTAAPSGALPHHHDESQRHHHDPHDGSVIVLDGTTPDTVAGDEPSSSAAQVLAFDSGPPPSAPTGLRSHWPRAAETSYPSRAPTPGERPPRG